MLSQAATNRWLLGLCISQYYGIEMQYFNTNKTLTSEPMLTMELWNSTRLTLPHDIQSWKLICSANLSLDFELSTASVVYESTQSLSATMMHASEQGVATTREYFMYGLYVAGTVMAITILAFGIGMIIQRREISHLRELLSPENKTNSHPNNMQDLVNTLREFIKEQQTHIAILQRETRNKHSQSPPVTSPVPVYGVPETERGNVPWRPPVPRADTPDRSVKSSVIVPWLQRGEGGEENCQGGIGLPHARFTLPRIRNRVMINETML